MSQKLIKASVPSTVNCNIDQTLFSFLLLVFAGSCWLHTWYCSLWGTKSALDNTVTRLYLANISHKILITISFHFTFSALEAWLLRLYEIASSTLTWVKQISIPSEFEQIWIKVWCLTKRKREIYINQHTVTRQNIGFFKNIKTEWWARSSRTGKTFL